MTIYYVTVISFNNFLQFDTFGSRIYYLVCTLFNIIRIRLYKLYLLSHFDMYAPENSS